MVGRNTPPTQKKNNWDDSRNSSESCCKMKCKDRLECPTKTKDVYISVRGKILSSAGGHTGPAARRPVGLLARSGVPSVGDGDHRGGHGEGLWAGHGGLCQPPY